MWKIPCVILIPSDSRELYCNHVGVRVDIDASFDRLLRRLSRRGSLTDEAIVYIEGVRGKIKQVDYALSRIQSLEIVETFRTSTHDTGSLLSDASRNINDQIAFYCDCIRDYLWSTIEILAQLINELIQLGFSESGVSFNKVADLLQGNYATTPITQRVVELKQSSAMEALKPYRHCSTHRRPIYVETSVVGLTTSGRAGYTSSTVARIQNISSYICDNPLEMHPRITNRRVIPYCTKMKQQIINKINRIIVKL